MFQIQERVRQYFAPVPSPGVCKGNKVCEFFQTNLTPIFNAFGLSCNIEGDMRPLLFLIGICTTFNVALFYWIYGKWRTFKVSKGQTFGGSLWEITSYICSLGIGGDAGKEFASRSWTTTSRRSRTAGKTTGKGSTKMCTGEGRETGTGNETSTGTTGD